MGGYIRWPDPPPAPNDQWLRTLWAITRIEAAIADTIRRIQGMQEMMYQETLIAVEQEHLKNMQDRLSTYNAEFKKLDEGTHD